MRWINGTRLDDRIIRSDWDCGFIGKSFASIGGPELYFIRVITFLFQKEDSTDEERLEDKSETNTEQIMIQAVADMVNEMKMLQIENGQ